MDRFSQELNRLEADLDNIRTILRWSIDSGRVDLGYRLTNNFWFWGDRATEGRRWLSELLALPGLSSHLMHRAYSLFCAGILAIIQGDFHAGRLALDEVESIAGHLQDQPLHNLARYGSAFILLAEDRHSEAVQVYLDLVKRMDKNREWWIVSWVFYALSSMMLLFEDYPKAQGYLHSALEIFESHNRSLGTASCIIKKGFIALAQRDYPPASSFFRHGLELANELGFQRGIGSCLCGFAGIALGTGELVRSARLFGVAEVMVKITGSRLSQLDEKAINERNLVNLRARLDENVFAAAWQEGMQMALEEVVVYALEGSLFENGFVR
jgi:hypothetical protein